MELQNKRLILTIVIITFLISSVGGFIFGVLGGISSYQHLSQKTAGSVKKSEIGSKITDFIQNELAPKDKINSEAGNGILSEKSDYEAKIVSAIKKASPAVVSIIITKDLPKIEQYNYNPFGNDPFFNQFFGQNFSIPQYQQQGTEKKEVGGGTGFIVTSDGLIVTNRHVVSDKQAEYTVLANDGKKYPAKVLAVDSVNDLAIIKIDQKNLPTLSLGDSSKLEVGQTAITIGNALGEFTNTAGLGIISGLRRSITASGAGTSEELLSNIIQTDATINPGNSGGPLLNINGEAIGVNVAMASGAENIGFAIPINDVKKIINDVKVSGRIIRPYLGVRYALINDAIKEKNNLSVNYGALILRGETSSDLAVIPGSPADKAGLAENDIILEVNGVKVDQDNRLENLISKYSVGDEITLKLLRKGEEKQIKVKLEERKQ